MYYNNTYRNNIIYDQNTSYMNISFSKKSISFNSILDFLIIA